MGLSIEQMSLGRDAPFDEAPVTCSGRSPTEYHAGLGVVLHKARSPIDIESSLHQAYDEHVSTAFIPFETATVEPQRGGRKRGSAVVVSSAVMPENRIEARAEGTAWLVTLTGERDVSTAPKLVEETAKGLDHDAVIVDLTAATFIHSSVLRAIIQADAHANRVIVVAAADSFPRRVLEITAVDLKIPVKATLEDAIKSL
jgi:anti-anti-sigma factor